MIFTYVFTLVVVMVIIFLMIAMTTPREATDDPAKTFVKTKGTYEQGLALMEEYKRKYHPVLGPWHRNFPAHDYELKLAAISKHDGSIFYIPQGYTCPRCSHPVGELEQGIQEICLVCNLKITKEGTLLFTEGEIDVEVYKAWKESL